MFGHKIYRNLWTLTTFSGAVDESWFYTVSIALEAHSAEIIRLCLDISEASNDEDYPHLQSLLHELATKINELTSTLVRMYEENIPAVFYQRVRPYLAGWLNNDALPGGIYYGNETTPRKYAGGSAAQSPLIQSLDIVLGIRHAKCLDHENTGVGSAGNYLVGMRRYMSTSHREFLGWLEENINIHAMLNRPGVPANVHEAFNGCVSSLRTFRDKHMAMVCAYVNVQATKCAIKGEAELKGTGGSNPIPFLKEIRSHMDKVVIGDK